jgi:hypothetical protein
MHILHIYTTNIPDIAQYVSNLSTMSGVHSDVEDQPKALQQMLNARCPDIVHVHGCSSEHIKIALKARQQGARIVLSPHGQLEPWEQPQAVTSRLMGINNLTSHAYCLIARSPIEADTLRELGWNKRIEIIPNPLITSTTTNEQCLQRHQRVYQQVMDSNILELMDENTISALRILLKVGITGDERWAPSFAANEVNWRQLLIYAQQEGILPLIEKGCYAKGVTIPDLIQTSAALAEQIPPTYLPDRYQNPVILGGQSLVEKVRTLQQQVADETLSLLSLAELDKALRCDDVDEDILMQLLIAEKLDTFFASLLTVLSEQTGFDEGFMPCPPLDNRDTNHIRTVIKNHLQI